MIIPSPVRGARRAAARSLVLSACLACVLAASATAEYTSVLVSNSYIKVVAGVTGSADLGDGHGGGTVDVDGLFAVGTTGGDPTSAIDSNAALLAGSDGTSATSLVPFGAATYIKVDDGDAILYGGDGGSWVEGPTVDSVNQVITDSFTTDEFPITVTRRLKPLRDNLQVTYEITNSDILAHSVGLVIVLDNEFGARGTVATTGGPFYTDLTGTVSYERSFTGAEVPSVIYSADELPLYTYLTQVLLRRSDVKTPDQVQLVSKTNATANPWGYQAQPNVPLLTDSATILKWNQQTVTAGGKLAPISFYFGLGNASQEFSYPAVAALQAPFTLSYVRNTGEETGHLEGDPFLVYGYVSNLSPEISLSGVQLQLTLPTGLEFATGESAMKSVGAIAPSSEGSAQWRVRANGLETGPVPVTLSAVGFPMTGKSVSRTIDIPGTEQRYFRGGIGKWQMVSLPFETASMDLATALGLNTVNCPQVWTDSPINFDEFGGVLRYQGFRWNPDSSFLSKYERVTAVPGPGEGFWFQPCSNLTLTLEDAVAVPDTTSTTRIIQLRPGWNQIGNPWLYSIAWGRFRVLKDASVGSVDLSEAIRQNWLNGTLYWLNMTTNQYDYSSAPATLLKPWMGYWVRAYEAVTLIVPRVDTIGGAGATTSGSGGGGNNNGGGGTDPPLPPVPWSTSATMNY